MAFKDNRTHLTFDDVCLVNGLSEVESRSDIGLSSELPKGYTLELPVMTAAMDTITSREMAQAMVDHGACIFHHRNQSKESRCGLLSSVSDHEKVKNKQALNGVAVGLNTEPDDIRDYTDAGANLIGVEVAHAYHVNVANTLKRIGPVCQEENVLLMVGNFSTVESIKWLEDTVGDLVDIVKVSQGGGSACTTRVVTGIGKPTLQAVMDLGEADIPYEVVSDGGIRSTGDIAKSIGAGACAGMLGNMLSGTDECPGSIIEKNGGKYKEYRGMASSSAKKDAQDVVDHKRPKNVEGVSTLNPYQGSVRDVLKRIREGLQSSISCCGYNCLGEFKEKASFIQISRSSAYESNPHADE